MAGKLLHLPQGLVPSVAPCCPGWPLTLNIVKDDFGLFLLPRPPKRCDGWYVLPQLVYAVLGIELRALCMLGKEAGLSVESMGTWLAQYAHGFGI